MTDMNDTENKYQGLMSAVRDIMMKNQNLYQQDREQQFYKHAPDHLQPQAEEPAPVEAPEVPEVEAQAEVTPEVDVPDPAPEAETFETPETPEE